MAAAWAALADARRYHGSCPLRARAASVDAARRAGHCSLSQCRFPLLLKAFRWKESVALRARPARSSSRKGAKAGHVTCLSRVRRGTRGRQRDVNLHELPRGHDGYPCFRVHGALRPEPATCVLRLYACARQSCALAPCNPPCALQHSTRVRRGSGDCFLKSPRLRPVWWRAGEAQAFIPLDQRQRDDNLAWFLPPRSRRTSPAASGPGSPSSAVLGRRLCVGR